MWKIYGVPDLQVDDDLPLVHVLCVNFHPVHSQRLQKHKYDKTGTNEQIFLNSDQALDLDLAQLFIALTYRSDLNCEQNVAQNVVIKERNNDDSLEIEQERFSVLIKNLGSVI